MRKSAHPRMFVLATLTWAGLVYYVLTEVLHERRVTVSVWIAF